MSCLMPGATALRVAGLYNDDGTTVWKFANAKYALHANGSPTDVRWVSVASFASISLADGKTYAFATEADHGSSGGDGTSCLCSTMVEIVTE
jgi:hypothetical protein